MIRGMYSAISGLKAHQTLLDVTANNLANVNTVGYKASRATFSDSLSQQVRGASAGTADTAGTNGLQVGLGVKVASVDNLVGSSSSQMTGNALDVALQGEGWLTVARGTPTGPAAVRPERPPCTPSTTVADRVRRARVAGPTPPPHASRSRAVGPSGLRPHRGPHA